MLSKKISNQIRKASEEMNVEELFLFLQELECDGKIEIRHDKYDRADQFALRMLECMTKEIERGNWWGYELRALKKLDDIHGDENMLIKIDAYGFPCEIEDNEDLLYILGIEMQK